MEKNNVKKICLLIIVLVVIIAVIVIKFSNSDKNTTSIKTNDNSNDVSTTIVEENSSKDAILDGKYTYVDYAGDISWEFSEDGKAACGGNMFVNKGTYEAIKENYIEIHYTQSKIWDDETSEATTNEIDEYEYITINPDDKLYLTDSHGQTEEIERIGDIVSPQDVTI